MDELRVYLRSLADKATQLAAGSSKIGEENTKAALITPLIKKLGWDVTNPEEVCHEYKYKSADNPVDYALLVARTPRLFVEAKGLGENLHDAKWANQAISYAAVAGVRWVALTDGARWHSWSDEGGR